MSSIIQYFSTFSFERKFKEFTLVEVIVVAVILIALAAAFAVHLRSGSRKGKNEEALAHCRNLVMAIQAGLSERYRQSDGAEVTLSPEELDAIASSVNADAGRIEALSYEMCAVTLLTYRLNEDELLVYDVNYVSHGRGTLYSVQKEPEAPAEDVLSQED